MAAAQWDRGQQGQPSDHIPYCAISDESQARTGLARVEREIRKLVGAIENGVWATAIKNERLDRVDWNAELVRGGLGKAVQTRSYLINGGLNPTACRPDRSTLATLRY